MKHTIISPSGITEVEYTDAEVTLHNEVKAAADAKAAEMYAYKTKAKADREAGNTKLLSLGLTQDQVTALTGYDPKS